jgi:uncharacterized protein (TIGR00369 family)
MHPLIQQYQEVNQFGKANGMELSILSPGKIQYTMMVKPAHMATPIVMHGGMIAGMMDAVVSVAGLSLTAELGQYVNTVEFKITFFKPAQLGDVLTGIGEIVKPGKTILFSEGTIFNQNNEIIAKATATLSRYIPK